MITWVTAMCLDPNPEGRSEGLTWILKNVSSIEDADHTVMIKPLVSCLNDKNKEIRTKSEEIISIVMPLSGVQAFIAATQDFTTAIK